VGVRPARVAVIALVAVVAALLVGAWAASGGAWKDPLNDHDTRLAFAVGIAVLLTFLFGYSVRDGLARHALQQARDPDGGPKRP